MNLLRAENLVKYYKTSGIALKKKDLVRAVDGISLTVQTGKTLGLVGESGCGKSTLARLLLHLEKPSAGKIFFKNKDITNVHGRKLIEFRQSVQVVFQDTYSSLNPMFTVGSAISDPLSHLLRVKKCEQPKAVARLLKMVDLDPCYADRYPHELSGGQRQRVGIARALAPSPLLLVCDEPVSSLDVSVQTQIMNLLLELKTKLKLACVFISHDLTAISHISDQVAVMYSGKIVEVLEKRQLVNAVHPYTKALLASIPASHPRYRRKNRHLKSEPPDPANLPLGCRFHPRCPIADNTCKFEEPLLREINNGHMAACHKLSQFS